MFAGATPASIASSGLGSAGAGGGGAFVTDWSPTHDPSAGVPPHPLHRSSGGRGSRQASTERPPAAGARQQQQGQFITESDLKRDFNFYPQQH